MGPCVMQVHRLMMLAGHFVSRCGRGAMDLTSRGSNSAFLGGDDVVNDEFGGLPTFPVPLESREVISLVNLRGKMSLPSWAKLPPS